MAFEFHDRDSDAVYRGKTLEFVIDDVKDIGEVYLDGDLIFQEDEIFSEIQLKKVFKSQVEVVESEPDNNETDVIGYDMDDDITAEVEITEEDEEELEERLYTKGGEFATEDGREFIGDYHIHPEKGAFIGKFYGKPTARLIPLEIEDVIEIRKMGRDPLEMIDYAVDEISDIDYEDDIIIEEEEGDFF